MAQEEIVPLGDSFNRINSTATPFASFKLQIPMSERMVKYVLKVIVFVVSLDN